MYYFSCDFDDIPFGLIRAKCRKGDMYETAYKWLAQYCDFFPPLWVSSDRDRLTGYNDKSGRVLFGFNSLNGFPVKYDQWMILLGILVNLDTNNFRYIDEYLVTALRELEDSGEIDLSPHQNLDGYLKSSVFVNEDQFAVQSLDLRQSHIIVCKDEVQRTNLSRRGFPLSIIKVSSVYTRSRNW
jgi:hypothetical protein